MDIRWKKYQKVVKSLPEEERHDLYSSPNIIRVMKSRVMRWVRHVACMGVYRIVQIFLVTDSEAKRYLGRPTCNWEDNTEFYRKK